MAAFPEQARSGDVHADEYEGDVHAHEGPDQVQRVLVIGPMHAKPGDVVTFTDRRSSDTGSELRRFIDYMSVTVPHPVQDAAPDGTTENRSSSGQ